MLNRFEDTFCSPLVFLVHQSLFIGSYCPIPMQTFIRPNSNKGSTFFYLENTIARIKPSILQIPFSEYKNHIDLNRTPILVFSVPIYFPFSLSQQTHLGSKSLTAFPSIEAPRKTNADRYGLYTFHIFLQDVL